MKSGRNACLRIAFLLFSQCFHLTGEETRPGLALRLEHKEPDFHKCDTTYGEGLSIDSCLRALSQIPNHGDPKLRMMFFQLALQPNDPQEEWNYQLPLRFVDPIVSRSQRSRGEQIYNMLIIVILSSYLPWSSLPHRYST